MATNAQPHAGYAMLMRKNIFIAFLSILAVATLVFVTYLFAGRVNGARGDEAAAEFEKRLLAELDAALLRQHPVVEDIAERFEEVDDLKTAQELRLRRYRNRDHLRAARELGVGRVSGDAEAARLAGEGRLVLLADNEYYYLQDFDYSVGYVTPDAARMLEQVGERFHSSLREQGLPLYRYNISSVLRTGENQRALGRINPNATRGVSTHEFGTTLDIVYHTFEYVPQPDDALQATAYDSLDARLETMHRRALDALGMRYWQELQGLLGRVLIDLQDEGVVMVTLEREQPVFHIPVARRLEP